MISIAHNGQELGQFAAEDVAAMLESGQIDQSAHYWMEGMTEWRPITEITQVDVTESGVAEANTEPSPKTTNSKRDPNTPNKAHLNFLSRRSIPTDGLTKESAAALVEQVKQDEKLASNAATPRQRAFLDYHNIAYGSEITKEEASDLISSADVAVAQWRKERHLHYPDLFAPPTVMPMTDKQRAYLDYHGVNYTEETTREEATALIEGVTRDFRFSDSKWNAYKHLIRPDLYAKPELSASSEAELQHAVERLAVAEAEHKSLQADSTAEPEDLEFAAQDIEDIREEIKDLKEQIKDDKVAAREESDYESTSFLEAWTEGYYEASGEDIEEFKKVLKKPTKAQYKALADKLAKDVGLRLSALSADQFCCLYVQQFPEALKETFKGRGFPELSLQIPKTYQQQLHMEGLSLRSPATNSPPAAAKKGCLGLVLMVAAPVGGVLAFIAVLVATR